MNKRAILVLMMILQSSCGAAPSGEYTAKVRIENGGRNYVIPIGCMVYDARPFNFFDKNCRHFDVIPLWFRLPEIGCVTTKNRDQFYTPPPTRIMLVSIYESKLSGHLSYKRTLMGYIYRAPKSDRTALPINTAKRFGRELVFPIQFVPTEGTDPKSVYADPAIGYVASCRDMTSNLNKNYVGSCQITVTDNKRDIKISFNPQFWNRRRFIVKSVKNYIKRFEKGSNLGN